MSVYEIKSYAVTWDYKQRKGKIQFIMAGKGNEETVAQVSDLRCEELAVSVDLLRNEKPVYFDTEYHTLHTGLEAVGENE
ncbi:MAG: hypothetical protein HY894_00790 [Deltaproteobacteria bacterium]|nr:hypothetical protein [Deltaproteobacteria bacterium]